jgi:hypothetical protein
MSTASPHLINDSNLSKAWAKAFLHLYDNPLTNPSPLLISIDGFNNSKPTEDPAIRSQIDTHLANHGKYSVDITAMTIFPYRTWNRKGRVHDQAFYDYLLNELFPRLKARSTLNRRGMYFERMMAYQGAKDGNVATLNQLRFVIDLLADGVANGHRPRHSALQISCFDPTKDHTGASRQGFPCLQQVSLAYDNTNGLALTAYYPTQFLFDRAYGNYLGLCHLAEFIAEATTLNVVRANFYITHPQLGTTNDGTSISKQSLATLAVSVRAALTT